jgi:acyl carrier protein
VEEVTNQVRKALHDYGRLTVEPASLNDDDDLYDAGLTSHSSVAVMLVLEKEFDIEFPDDALGRETFRTISSLEKVISAQLAVR